MKKKRLNPPIRGSIAEQFNRKFVVILQSQSPYKGFNSSYSFTGFRAALLSQSPYKGFNSYANKKMEGFPNVSIPL